MLDIIIEISFSCSSGTEMSDSYHARQHENVIMILPHLFDMDEVNGHANNFFNARNEKMM